MEISAKVLRDVEFSGSLRGYNTDEVDEFLEQVAVAVDRLVSETRLASERAESDRAGRDRTGVEDEESIRRTLVLAQRTADLAIKEAQEEAALLLDQARAEAETVITEAQQTAERLATDAEQELRDEVARLTALRESLQTESDTLVSLLETERARLTESLSTALRYVERTLRPPAAGLSAGSAANPFAGADGDRYSDDAGVEASTAPNGADAGPDGEAEDRRQQMAGAQVRESLLAPGRPPARRASSHRSTTSKPISPRTPPSPVPHRARPTAASTTGHRSPAPARVRS